MEAAAFRILETGDDQLVDAAFEHVFRPAFDVTELPDVTHVRPQPGRVVLVVLDGEDVVAGAVTDTIPRSDIGLLSYMATQAGGRSRGLGSAVVAELQRRWADDGASVVLAEVRDPRVWPASDTERPLDRLRFYERNRCYLVPKPWIQPAVDAESREAGMLLLAVHGAEVATRIDGGRLTRWAASYYRDAEGREPSDPQYHALIEALRADVDVSPIADYPSVPLLPSVTA